MNMFKATKAKTVREYIDSVPGERKNDIVFLHTLIQKTVPKLKSYFAHNMLGYGSFPYLNYKKELIKWPTIALANQKQYISVYVCSMDHGMYVAEKYKKALGHVRVGRSCISFKKIEDINIPVFKKVLKTAAKNPGLVSAEGANKKK